MKADIYCLLELCIEVSREAPKATDWLSVALTGASLITAAVVAWYAFRTFFAASRSVEEAKRSAQAAEDALNQLKHSEMRRERAYVFVKGTTVSGLGTAPRIGTAVTIQNFGLTPATLISARVYTSIVEMPIPNEPIPDRIVLGQVRDIVPQGVERTYTMTHPQISIEQIEQMRRGNLAILIKGELAYEDVFGSLHHSTYQWFLTGEMETGMALTAPVALWVHPEGNHAD
jgi:hypothetical protein